MDSAGLDLALMLDHLEVGVVRGDVGECCDVFLTVVPQEAEQRLRGRMDVCLDALDLHCPIEPRNRVTRYLPHTSRPPTRWRTA
jgi:hypothetical protein